jgi:hypothetical protein
MQTLKLSWPGGEHEFALRIGELRALQGAVGAGPEEVFNRLRVGNWRADDLTQVLKWGLVGGGMEKGQAAQLVTSLIDLHPLMQFKLAALAVMGHALLGDLDGDEEPGKPEAGENPANGNSETSTEPEPS